MTECEKLRDDLKAFQDGQLSPAARIAVRMHLNRCAACRKEIEEMQSLGTRMRAADRIEMSDALRDRILASIPTGAPEPKVKMLPRWREKPVMLWGACASAALAWFLLYPALNKDTDYKNTVAAQAIGQTEGRYSSEKVAAAHGRSEQDARIDTTLAQRFQSDGYEKIETDPARSATERPLGVKGWRDGVQAQPTPKPADQVAQNNKAAIHYYFAGDTAGNLNGYALKNTSSQETFHIGRGYLLEETPTERQVHREASLTVEVPNAEQQSEAVERLVKESKGYVAQNELTTQEDHTRQASLTCKVPVDQFDTVMGQIARLGLLKGKTLSGEDITEKISDEQETGHVLRADIAATEAKLKTRRRHADTVRDEESLRQLRIRIAQSQAHLKMLTRLGELAEITVELDEKPKNAVPAATKPTSPFMQEISGTGQAAAHAFLMALRLPIQLLVWMVVYSPLWALLFFAYRRMTR